MFSPEGGCSEGLDAFRFFLNLNIKHVGNVLTSSYCGKIRDNALTAGIRRVSGSFSETESRCLDSSVTLLPRSLTF